ncbi:MAG: T9SS C-terminal target domain-containing protein, partial [Calditrichaeota bacterium]
DKTVLSAGGASSAGTLSGAFGPPTVNTTVEGEITVGGFGTAPLEGSGILVNLFFNVVGQLGDQTPLTFVKFLFNGGDPQADTQDGQFQVALPTGIFTPVARLNFLQLGQNYPNPFNPQTAIPLQVPPGWEKPLALRIYNAKGQIVRTLAQRRYVPGRHIFYWDSKNEEGRPVPSGVYFYKIQSGRFILSKRMVLLR